MKKYLPFILLFVGLLITICAFVFVRKAATKQASDGVDDEVVEVPLEARPVVSLTPRSDGHYLDLKIIKLTALKASSLTYEFLYVVPGQDQPQGSAPTVDIKGKDDFITDLLLGTESSGKFRYDEGVEKGTLTLTFRNDQGKLLGKFSTGFSLSSSKDLISIPDGEFTISLDKTPKKEYFVVMETWGIPDSTPTTISKGPYGLFSSIDIKKLSGKVSMGGSKIFMHITGSLWEEFNDGSIFDTDTGIFYGSSK